jgi:hypothetical protein
MLVDFCGTLYHKSPDYRVLLAVCRVKTAQSAIFGGFMHKAQQTARAKYGNGKSSKMVLRKASGFAGRA